MLLKRRRRTRGLIVLPGHEAQKRSDLAHLIGREADGGDRVEEQLLAHIAIGGARVAPDVGHSDGFFLAATTIGDVAGRLELAEGIVDRVRVLDIQDVANIGERFSAVTVADCVKDENLEGRQAGMTGGGHAPGNPTMKGVSGDHQAKLELGNFRERTFGEMRGRDDGAEAGFGHRNLLSITKCQQIVDVLSECVNVNLLAWVESLEMKGRAVSAIREVWPQ